MSERCTVAPRCGGWLAAPVAWLSAMLASMLSACTTPPADDSIAQRAAALRATEQAFADTMARRDLAAFAGFVAEDAVFINGGQPLRGREAVVAHWRGFFAGAQAPFAWRPELVEIAGRGDIGYTEGPVSRPSGEVFARFYTTWRREADGRWRAVFDNGYAVAPARPASAP